MNAAAVRKAFEEGVARMEQALATDRRIAWLSLAASSRGPYRGDLRNLRAPDSLISRFHALPKAPLHELCQVLKSLWNWPLLEPVPYGTLS